MVKKISCCGCYFDKIYYIVYGSGRSFVNFKIFDTDYDWVFTNLVSEDVTVICENIFELVDVKTCDRLYEFDLTKKRNI